MIDRMMVSDTNVIATTTQQHLRLQKPKTTSTTTSIVRKPLPFQRLRNKIEDQGEDTDCSVTRSFSFHSSSSFMNGSCHDDGLDDDDNDSSDLFICDNSRCHECQPVATTTTTTTTKTRATSIPEDSMKRSASTPTVTTTSEDCSSSTEEGDTTTNEQQVVVIEPSSSSSSTIQQKKKKVVRFHLIDSTKSIESYKSMSTKEIKKYWWHRNEISRMKPNSFSQLEKLYTNCYTKKECIRGLEYRYWTLKIHEDGNYSPNNLQYVKYVAEYVPPPRSKITACRRYSNNMDTNSKTNTPPPQSPSPQNQQQQQNHHHHQRQQQQQQNHHSKCKCTTNHNFTSEEFHPDQENFYATYLLVSQERARVLGILDEAYVMEHIYDLPNRYNIQLLNSIINDVRWDYVRCCSCFNDECNKQLQLQQQQQQQRGKGGKVSFSSSADDNNDNESSKKLQQKQKQKSFVKKVLKRVRSISGGNSGGKK